MSNTFITFISGASCASVIWILAWFFTDMRTPEGRANWFEPCDDEESDTNDEMYLSDEEYEAAYMCDTSEDPEDTWDTGDACEDVADA